MLQWVYGDSKLGAHIRGPWDLLWNLLQLRYLDLYLIHFPISLQFVPFEVRYPPEPFGLNFRGTGKHLNILARALIVRKLNGRS